MKTKIIIVFLISITLFSCKTEEDKKNEVFDYLKEKIYESETQFANITSLIYKNKEPLFFEVTNSKDINSDVFLKVGEDFQNFQDEKKYKLKGNENFDHTLFVICNKEDFTNSRKNSSNLIYKSFEDNYPKYRYSESIPLIVKIQYDNKKFTDSLYQQYKHIPEKTFQEIDEIFRSVGSLKYIAFIKYIYAVTPTVSYDINGKENGYLGGYVCANVNIFNTETKRKHKSFDVYVKSDEELYFNHNFEKILYEDLIDNIIVKVKYKLYYNKN
jgi:hypothetical protein